MDLALSKKIHFSKSLTNINRNKTKGKATDTWISESLRFPKSQ